MAPLGATRHVRGPGAGCAVRGHRAREVRRRARVAPGKRVSRCVRRTRPSPGSSAASPSSSSIRSSWLYLATRSERDGAPVLIWPQPVADGQVGDRRVLGLAGAVRHDRAVARLAGHPDRLEGLGQGADLVDLDEDRVGDAGLDPAAQALGVGDEEVVADELAAVADLVGQGLPAVPVLLVHPVLDRDDRVAVDRVGPVGGQLGRGERAVLVGELVGAVGEDLARRRVERDEDVARRARSRPPRSRRPAPRAPPRWRAGRARSRPRRRPRC